MSIFPNSRSLKEAGSKLQSLVTATLLGLQFFAVPCEAVVPPINHTWYVSSPENHPPTQIRPTYDGRSWDTAWPELNLIDWKQIHTGDTINISGGVYHTPLEIQQNQIKILCGYAPITQRTPSANTVNIISPGATNLRYGIRTLGRSAIQIIGANWKTIVVSGWPGAGVIVDAGSTNITLSNMEIAYNGQPNGPDVGTGLVLNGSVTTGSQLVIHDNKGANVALPGATLNGGISANALRRCWIGNFAIPAPSVKADGVRISAPGAVTIDSCILGPGLKIGALVDRESNTTNIVNTLFINPETANVLKTPYAGAHGSAIRLTSIVSFLTPLNSQNKAHSCLDFGITSPASDFVTQSSFYGGTVSAISSAPGRYGNIQYKTNGNTIYLSPTQTSFSFKTNVSNIPNNPPLNQLVDADYTPTIPYNISGNCITSVRQLLSTNKP